jgi:hypothetical protein
VELVSHALHGDRGDEKGAADRSGRPILFVTT